MSTLLLHVKTLRVHTLRPAAAAAPPYSEGAPGSFPNSQPSTLLCCLRAFVVTYTQTIQFSKMIVFQFRTHSRVLGIRLSGMFSWMNIPDDESLSG
eukprot:scaffold50831_cov14-Tisochrysis_lutea.AAC.1